MMSSSPKKILGSFQDSKQGGEIFKTNLQHSAIIFDDLKLTNEPSTCPMTKTRVESI